MNAPLSTDLARIRAELELQVADRTSELARANEELKRELGERDRLHAESVLLTAFSAEVGAALTRAENHGEALRLCAESMMRHLGADMASVWTLDEPEGMLDLSGNAWAKRPLFQPDARLPIGESPIGRVASERKPLVLDLTTDRERDDGEDWARREGMVAFVGHPLVVAEQLVGVMAMFSKRQPNAAAVLALGTVADGIALGIARENFAEALRVSEASNRAVIDNMLTGLITTDERSVIETFNPAAERMFGYSASEIVGQHLSVLLPSDVTKEAVAYLREARDKALGRITEWGARRRNGEIFTMELALFEFQTPDRHRHYAGSVRDVSTAREVERLKSEFVSTVSHELRTPLTSIRGALGLVNGGVAGEIPDRARALLEIAYQNTERLSRLVNDILDLEKLDAGRMDLCMEPLHAAIFLESLVEANQAYAAPYGVTLEFRRDGLEAWILADRDRLGQVVTNLVSNAIKFSSRGETVTVSLSRDVERSRVRVTVADRGAGIPEAFRGRIFERFQQADSSDTRQKGGTGLGLAITKSIVERLGGQISFDTTAGRGTSFHVDLPESRIGEPVHELPRAGAA